VDKPEKDESEVLETRVENINSAFMRQFPNLEWAWVMETHEDDKYVIADANNEYYKVGYSYTDDIGYAFSDPVQWARVQRKVEWEEMSKAQKSLEFELDACPKKRVRVLKSTDDALTIGAYATIWGELDCDGERMQKEALQPYVDSNATPYMFWLHGWDGALGSTIIGEWDKTTFTIDDVGLYVEGKVTHPEAIRRLQESGDLGLSVGSNPQYVQVDGIGNITDWALLEISVMEGGKQCVPSAHSELAKNDKEYDIMLRQKAVELGVVELTEEEAAREERETRAREEVRALNIL